VGGCQVYCVKTGTDTADSSTMVQKTVTTRILPVPSNEKPSAPEFWDYLAGLSLQDWTKHILYMYRTEPSGPAGQSVPMGKFVDTSSIPWGDREEAELAIMQKFGGRLFRVIVKRGPERVCEGKIYIDAQPRTVAPPQPEVSASQPGSFPMSEANSTAYVANQAITTMANQDRQAVEIGISALAQAANVIKNFANQPSGQDDLTKQIMAVLIQRALAPPPDPMEAMAKFMTLFQTMSTATNPGGAVNPMMQKVLDVAIEKVLNPAPSGPVSSAGAELVRQLPQVASYVTQALSSWAHGREAERDIVAMTTRNGTAAPPRSQQPALQPAPAPQPNPVPQPTNGSAVTMPSLEFVESKIVEILACPISPEAAAEEVTAFLQVMDGPTGQLVPSLIAQGEAGLMGLFQARPTLKPATTNLPRLTEFIREFLKYAGENAEDGQSGKDIPRPN
jgi:hypothetical protein